MNLKYIACVLGGGAAGSALTYIFIRRKECHKCNKKVEELRNQYNEIFRNQDENISELRETIDNYRRRHDEVLNEIGYSDHSEDPIEPEDFEADLEMVEAPEEEEYGEMDIYAIGIRDFMQDAKYEKQYLTFYRGDEIMLNQNEEPVNDIRGTLGDMELLVRNFTGEVMYIRNTRTDTDYQIDFDDGTAAEVIGSDP